MSGEGAGAGAGEAPPPGELDERDVEPRTPMKRLGSTRKLAAFNSIRLQLAEQTRVLEARAEAACGVAGELHDYCRRRAELELEYARALDKLARGPARRAPRAAGGALACWRAALEAARTLARDHAALGALYAGPLAARLQRAADDALRLHRKCRDVLLERHAELGAALAAAAGAGKAHAAAHAAWRAAAGKLRQARELRRDPPKHKKIKALDKELDKRRARHGAARAEALRARVEYALSLEAANAALRRHYRDDAGDVLACAEVGFEAVVARVVRAAAGAERARGAAAGGAAAALRLAADALDARADRARLLAEHAAFAAPRELPAPDAEPPDAEPEPPGDEERALLRELDARLQQLEAAARELRAECRENAKTLDAAEAELVKQMEGADEQWDVSSLFGASALGGDGTSGAVGAPPPPLDDQEDYYLAKFRAYVSSAGRLARVESKAAALRSRAALGEPAAPAPPPASPPRRAAPAPRPAREPFDAPLDERLPRVLTECVRVICTYGLRQQGLFRVSGSQVEMQALRAAFERGEEPLAGVRDAADMNSVCGLLKLWLRSLRPPLLPGALHERLLAAAALPDDAACALRLRAALQPLPAPHALVLRYLFAFLAHVAAHSARTCMDAWNLAICVGPTLLAAGSADRLHRQHLLNELVKRIILLHERVFPQDVAPHALFRPPAPAPRPDEPDPQAGEPPAPAPDAGPAPPPAPAGQCRRLADSTPDLVLDLPLRPAPPADAAPPADDSPPADDPPPAEVPTPADAGPPADPEPPSDPEPLAVPVAATPVDSADTFAHNSDTLKKRPQPKRAESPDAAAADAGAGGGSPVPARNTARVCAKFAELTLTGGSLKPALAAKPALLRRAAPPAAPPAPLAPLADAAPQPPLV